MPRSLPGCVVALTLLCDILTACTSSSAYAGVPHTPLAVVEPTESLHALAAQPTEGPDPVATEYALAALETPIPVRISNPIAPPTPDLLKQLETYAVKPTVAPPPDRVNDLPFESFSALDHAVIDHMREIFVKGQALGRNPRAFSKAGDSTIESPYFLGRFDDGSYNLGDYKYLQAVVEHFTGSYGRKSLAVRIGQHSWTLLNPAWADKQQCQAAESPLACEFRVNNPSLVILRLGANDAGVLKTFDKNMRAVVEYAIAQGVIPVLSTKPDQRKGTEQINDALRKIAIDYKIPLWDFARVAETLPGHGLGADGVHLTGFYQHDYTLPQAFQRGHGLQNLTALIVLDRIWQVLEQH
ncbi:hypothetical protein TFLX_00779 [Thermoflexales bacterium]|nr:hypothetical protein TFLX_00779 [Thermoflexales bacterium]